MPNSVRWMALVCGSLLIGVACTHFGVMYGIWWPTWGVVASCGMLLVMGEDILQVLALPTVGRKVSFNSTSGNDVG